MVTGKSFQHTKTFIVKQWFLLAEAPEILQSIGPGGKLFKAKFNTLRFDEDVVFCEEHTFVTRAYLMSRDIQLVPFIVYGYNEREGSITDQRADTFISYLEDARKVRREVMDMLLLVKEKHIIVIEWMT